MRFPQLTLAFLQSGVLTNFIGNAVATIVVARWERAVDLGQLRAALAGRGGEPRGSGKRLAPDRGEERRSRADDGKARITVIPAKAGTSGREVLAGLADVPAFAGMTTPAYLLVRSTGNLIVPAGGSARSWATLRARSAWRKGLASRGSSEPEPSAMVE
jgi:hypothetical protein